MAQDTLLGFPAHTLPYRRGEFTTLSTVSLIVCYHIFCLRAIKFCFRAVFEKVKQKMPCFFNKLFCVILCILSSTNRPPAKAPPVACVLSCYFRVLCVRFSLKYE